MKTELCMIAEKYKTDKTPSIFHSYTPAYHEMFKDRRDSVKRVLEFGIGYPETMKWGKTDGYVAGASLFMWRDYFPHATIFAVDIKPELVKALQREARIVSLRGDQHCSADLQRLKLVLAGNEFDLIVDDGSHIAEDQLLTAELFYDMLAPDGVHVIEDVSDRKVLQQLRLPHAVKEFASGIGDDRLIVITKQGEAA